MPSPEELESQMHRMLRGLPDRQAPSGFEARVMAELARRAVLPWWKRSYAAWPAPARLLFFVTSALAAAVLVVGAGRALRVVVTWIAGGNDLVSDLSGAVTSLYHQVPTLWMYGILGALGLAYLLLVSAGSVLYRNLIRPATLSP